MPEILFFSPILPYPPFDGDHRRVSHLLEACALQGRVDFVHVGNEQPTAALRQRLEQRGIRLHHFELSLGQRLRAALVGSLAGWPLGVGAHYSQHLAQRIQKQWADRPVDLVYAYRLKMSAYANRLQCPRTILDCTDSLTRHYGDRCRRPGIGWWEGARDRYEYSRLQQYEPQQARRAWRVVVSGPEDARALAQSSGRQDIAVISNAVDDAVFTLERRPATPCRILFVANLHYPPNAMGWRRFLQSIWSQIRKACPEAKCDMVGQGAGPHAPGVMYHGVAEDLKCFWERAAVGIAPLWLASGRQFKVIEYLAAGVPTVTTPVVARNLGVQSGRELLALEDDASFASAVIRLCREPEFGAGIGAAGRNFARAHFSLTRVRQAVADLCREAWA